MVRMLAALRADLRNESLLPQVARTRTTCPLTGEDLRAEPFEMNEATFVDDAVLSLMSKAVRLENLLAKAAEVSERACARFGAILDWAHGKSEATIRWRGPGATVAKQ